MNSLTTTKASKDTEGPISKPPYMNFKLANETVGAGNMGSLENSSTSSASGRQIVDEVYWTPEKETFYSEIIVSRILIINKTKF